MKFFNLTSVTLIMSSVMLIGCDDHTSDGETKKSAQADSIINSRADIESHPGKLSVTFSAVDDDGDGYINRREANNTDVWYYFGAIDQDKDEVISEVEFEKYLAKNSLSPEENTSTLTQAELREIAKDQGKDSDIVADVSLWQKIDSDFGSLDNDDDGKISREESDDDEIYKHFSRVDTDNNNLISVVEYNSYVSKYGEDVATESVINSVIK